MNTWKSDKQLQQEHSEQIKMLKKQHLEELKELKEQHKQNVVKTCLALCEDIKDGVGHIHRVYDTDFKIDKSKIDRITNTFIIFLEVNEGEKEIS